MKPKDRARTSRRFNRRSFLLAASASAPLIAHAEDSPPELYGEYPKEGLVPNEETAIAIAKAVARARFGASALNRTWPVRATLVGGGKIWEVGEVLPPDTMGVGGSVSVHISRFNGCISLLKTSRK
jgi:hypothetical protein